MSSEEGPRIPKLSDTEIAPNNAVLTPQEYLADFEKEARDAESITVQVMAVEPGEVADIALRIFRSAPVSAQKTFILITSHS